MTSIGDRERSRAPLNLSSATHVAFGTITAERLSRLGAANVVCAKDCLLVGPSRGEPGEHERERRAWWGVPESETLESLTSPLAKWDLPVVVWMSASIGQKLKLWRTCKWLRHLGIAARDVRVLELEPAPPRGPREGPPPPFDCISSVSHHSDETLVERLARAEPFSQARYEQAVSLWDSFAAPDPRPFADACLRGLEGFPELPSLWACLSCFVPRRAPTGGLRLSRFDALLLDVLSGDWQSPVAVFVHKSLAGEELRQLGSCTGDLFFPRRLEHWAQHGAVPAIERAAGPQLDNRMKAAVYRITERGRELRERGLARITDGPELPIAGTAVYSSSAPWVLLEDGRLDRLA